MKRIEDTTIEAVLEHLIADGAGGIGPAFTRMFELAMRLERERYLGAGHYEGLSGISCVGGRLNITPPWP
jgi:hypothetical protein